MLRAQPAQCMPSTRNTTCSCSPASSDQRACRASTALMRAGPSGMRARSASVARTAVDLRAHRPAAGGVFERDAPATGAAAARRRRGTRPAATRVSTQHAIEARIRAMREQQRRARRGSRGAPAQRREHCPPALAIERHLDAERAPPARAARNPRRAARLPSDSSPATGGRALRSAIAQRREARRPPRPPAAATSARTPGWRRGAVIPVSAHAHLVGARKRASVVGGHAASSSERSVNVMVSAPSGS